MYREMPQKVLFKIDSHLRYFQGQWHRKQAAHDEIEVA
jgi:hypothetical protein